MANETLIDIGFENYVVKERVAGIVSPQSSPMRKLREEAASERRLIDATHGRKTRAIIVLDSNHIVLSAIQPKTLKQRFMQEEIN
ncbi:MAG: DUF370 domain-containing protein [Desulfovibrio sp.]|nr:DUF370 domain-containing protein [Desulfovibrio sp.]